MCRLTRFNIVVAIDEENGIGKNGTIPWRNKQDLINFRRITTTVSNEDIEKLSIETTVIPHNAVIMGRKTYESLPPSMRPLPNRRNIVVSSNPISDVETVSSLADALRLCMSNPKTFVIGGQRLYEEALNKYSYLCDNIFVSHISGKHECGVFFPYLKASFLSTESSVEIKDGLSVETIKIKQSHPEQQYLDLLSLILQNR